MRENKYIVCRDVLYKIVPGDPLHKDDFNNSTFTYNDPLDRIYRSSGIAKDGSIYWELVPQGQYIDSDSDGTGYYY